MKLLLDTCVWGGARANLQGAGHDVIWSGDWQQDPGDEEILALADRENRVLITLDKDFGELAIVKRLPHSGIVRLVDIRAREQGRTILLVVNRYHQELLDAAIITVQVDRIRIRSSAHSGRQGL